MLQIEKVPDDDRFMRPVNNLPFSSVPVNLTILSPFTVILVSLLTLEETRVDKDQ